MFGQTGNTSFGGFNTVTQSSPFAQSAFGKPIATTSFGTTATPVFGNNNSLFNTKPAGTTSGGLFGNSTGTTAFGQPVTTQSTFGGFGTANMNANLFGAQQPANTNLFGSSTAPPAFGQANKPSGFGYGTSTSSSLFGQPQQTPQQTTPFGQANASANTGLFSSTTGFGATNTGVVMAGTVVKFSPVTGSDTMMKNGLTQTITTRHHCITCMKEYEQKSLEELRLEDYTAGRKGSQNPTTGLFGSPGQPSLFGVATAGTSATAPGFGSTSGGFGTTSQAGGAGLFNKPITGFGVPTTTTNAFAFNSTTPSNLFGTNSQVKPFGAAAPAPLFSSTNTAPTAGTGFGTTQNTGFGNFGAMQPNQSIGLFNQNKSAFALPAPSTNTGFGGFGQPTTTNTGTGLFGAKPAGTLGFGTSTFGATTTPFGTNVGFGNNPNTNTSLFNNPFKPAGQATGFSFGTSGTTTGLNLSGGTSLFNQQKPGGLFGSNPSGFNSSVFGTSTGFGTGTVSSFGNNMLGGVGMNQSQSNTSSVPVHQQILALVSAPFGDSPLFRNLLPASGKTEELLKPVNFKNRSMNSPQYKVSTNNSPRIKSIVVTSPQSSKKSLFEDLGEDDPSLLEAFQPRPNAKHLVLRPKPVTDISTSAENTNSSTNGKSRYSSEVSESRNKENQESQSPTSEARSSTTWLKSSMSRKKSPEEVFDGQQSPFRESDVPPEGFDDTIAELRPNVGNKNQISISPDSSLNADKSSSDSIGRDSDSPSELDDTPRSSLQSEGVAELAQVKLQRVGYYTIPPLEKLDDYVCGETCIVPNFTIGREGYGNIHFPDSFDIYGLNLDEIVHLRHKEVIIYPDDGKKPPIGRGLNRRAQVTLDRVWPHDKSRHEPITDPRRLEAMNYEGKLRRASAKYDTRFIEYRSETGSWVFKVDHFSKYGLSDSDDESDSVNVQNLRPKKITTWMRRKSRERNYPRVQVIPTLNNSRSQSGAHPQFQSKHESGLQSRYYPNSNSDCRLGEQAGPTSMYDRIVGTDSRYQSKHQSGLQSRYHPDSDSDCRLEEQAGPTTMYDRIVGTDGRRIQLMKADSSGSDDSTFERFGEQASPTSMYDRIVGTDSRKIQLMKADFFGSDDSTSESTNGFGKKRGIGMSFDYHTTVMKHVPLLRSNLTLQQTQHNFDSRIHENKEAIPKRVEEIPQVKSSSFNKILPAPFVQPKTVVLKSRTEVMPLKDSFISRLRLRCLADFGIQMGRMCRPSWGPGLTLLSLSTQEQATNIYLRNNLSHLGSYISGRLPDDRTSSIVQRLQILGGSAESSDYLITFKESIESHLKIQLYHSIVGQESDCPMIIRPNGKSGVAALHSHLKQTQDVLNQISDNYSEDKMTKYYNDVWRLCVALWGDLSELEPNDDELVSHKTVMVRKEAFSEWLKTAVEETVRCNISEMESEDQIMFELITANKLDEACSLARNVVGDHCLGLLMSQFGGSTSVRELIKRQLAFWQETEVDNDMTIPRLKLFMLVAGEPLICSRDGTVNVCENLDWKRTLALHLWYLSQPTASIRDVLENYERSFDTELAESYGAKPHPVYVQEDYEIEFENGKSVYDLCFHLLKLYTTGDYPVEKILNPLNHTPDPLDYRLSWLIQEVLIGLGYSHLSEDVEALTHTNFVTQLESYDLWHWSIFVLLHLKDSGKRRKGVMDLLSRHVNLNKDSEYVNRENFLIEELGIQPGWINEAKGVKAYSLKRYEEAAWYFTQAEMWNRAHEIVIEHLAADAIINENYDYLKNLLAPLIQEEGSNIVSGWAHQGQLLWDYMEVTASIKSLLKTSDYTDVGYKLELLQPQLISLCSKINHFPCPTAKHRLCQAEIAKRTIQLARSILMLQSTDTFTAGKILLQLISQLPLPEDYAQQELRPIINMYAMEVVK